MLISEYLNNPYGKGSTFVNVKLIREDLTRRYNELIKKNVRIFTSFIYKTDNGYYCHIRIPSETIDQMTYDVIIYIKNENSLIANNSFKAFSNCPSFVFTHAHVFNEKNLIISELDSKLDSKVLSKDPEIRNPKKNIGYEKSIFYAMTYLVQHFINTNTLDRFAKKFDLNKLKSKVRDDKLILQQYRRYKRKQELSERQKSRESDRKKEKEDNNIRQPFHRIESKPKMTTKGKVGRGIIKKKKIGAKKKR